MKITQWGICLTLACIVVAAAWVPAAVAQPPEREHQQDPQNPPNRDPHGPGNIERYISRLEDPKRRERENPEEVIRALKIRPTDWVVDLGCGPGFYARHLAGAVPQGIVFAVDVEPRQLDRLNEHLASDGITNVIPVLTPPDDPRVPPGCADVLLIVDTYHHFDNRPEYLKKVKRALKPDGRLVIIDYYKRPLPVGPPPGHKLAKDVVLAEMEAAGFKKTADHTMLEYQYFLEFVVGE